MNNNKRKSTAQRLKNIKFINDVYQYSEVFFESNTDMSEETRTSFGEFFLNLTGRMNNISTKIKNTTYTHLKAAHTSQVPNCLLVIYIAKKSEALLVGHRVDISIYFVSVFQIP